MRVWSITCLKCLHALSAYALYVPTCLRASNYYMTTCLKLLCAYETMCPYFSRASVPSFFTCLRAYMSVYIFLQIYIYDIYFTYMPVYIFISCLRALIFHVLTCLQPLTKYIVAHFYTLYCCFSLDIWPFIPFKTPKQTPASKTAYPNPILCCFAISTGACTETIIWGLIKRLSKTMDSF